MKHVNASVKSIARVQKIIIGILAHVFVRMVGVSKLFLMIQKLCEIINVKDRRIVKCYSNKCHEYYFNNFS